MNDYDQTLFDRAIRVQTFGTNNAGDYARDGKALTLFGNLDQYISRLRQAGANQVPNHVSKETLISSEVIDQKNIARTARAIELDSGEPGFAGPYRMPDNSSETAVTRHGDAVLACLEDQAADSAAVKTAKAALRARFIAYELPDTFVADLRAEHTAVAEANRTNQTQTQQGVANTRLIGELLGKINEVIIKLSAIMHNKYTRDPAKLRAWRSASHVERAPQRLKKTAATATASASVK